MRLHVEDSSKTKGEFENVDKVKMVNNSKICTNISTYKLINIHKV